MKVLQEQLPFRVITIKLESKSEAKALFDLIDKIEDHRVNGDIDPNDFTKDEVKMIKALSDMRTDKRVVI